MVRVMLEKVYRCKQRQEKIRNSFSFMYTKGFTALSPYATSNDFIVLQTRSVTRCGVRFVRVRLPKTASRDRQTRIRTPCMAVGLSHRACAFSNQAVLNLAGVGCSACSHVLGNRSRLVLEPGPGSRSAGKCQSLICSTLHGRMRI